MTSKKRKHVFYEVVPSEDALKMRPRVFYSTELKSELPYELSLYHNYHDVVARKVITEILPTRFVRGKR